ncbi:MAG TPA: hypothetical protein VMW72_24845 [Sedimentisphaerales bacterium]|nr:hypothetical protein [Sedimentisphaerales bacterium]
MEEDHKLLKTQKNQVLKIIYRAGLESANFFWTTQQIPDTSIRKIIQVPRLNYIDGENYFRFEKYSCTFSPGVKKAVQHEAGSTSESFGGQLYYVDKWARCLKREIEAPDLWAEMEKYKTSVSLALPEQILNEPIPVYEVDEIANKLKQLADKIKEQFELTDEQNQFVHNKLNYLADAAKRQRSIDWVHTSIGVIVTMSMGLALAPDQAKRLWELMRSIVGGFIHLIGS